MYIQLLDCSTYTTFPWCLHYLELSWNLDQPESHQSSRYNMKLVCDLTSILIERTSGIPKSNTKKIISSLDHVMLRIENGNSKQRFYLGS